jgi:hypothetical protein
MNLESQMVHELERLSVGNKVHKSYHKNTFEHQLPHRNVESFIEVREEGRVSEPSKPEQKNQDKSLKKESRVNQSNENNPQMQNHH